MTGQTEVARVRIPFTAYDIFGYLIPGITLAACIFAFEIHLRADLGALSDREISEMTPLLTLLTETRTRISGDSWSMVLLIFVAILACYVLGHVVATLSSLLIDRMLVFRGYGYPSEFLLTERRQGGRENVSRPIYRGLFFWANCYVAIRYVQLVFPSTARTTNFVGDILAYGIMCLLFVAFVGSEIRNRNSGPLYRFFYRGRGCASRGWITACLRAQAAPYDVPTRYLSHFLDSRKAFDEKFRDRFAKYFESNFQVRATDAATNRYWLSYCYVVDRSPVFAAMLSNWLHLYAFARNLAVAFLLAFLASFLTLASLDFVTEISLWSRVFPAAMLFCACILLIRYYYLYVCYYSRFLFRSFVYINEMNERGKRR